MLAASVKMIRENPVFGVGFDSFGYYYLLYGGHWETLAYDAPTPHNSYVQVLTTMGFAAFIPYVLVFLSILWNILLALRRARRSQDKSLDPALLVAGAAAVVVYMVSAAAVDLFVIPFLTLICFAIAGTIMGYVSQHSARYVRAQRDSPAPTETEA
jgi:O-antigen ligase